MVKHFEVFLITGCLIGFGCASFPKRMYIQENWTPAEEEAITSAVEAWNEALKPYVGEPVIVYKGRGDQFFSLEDLDDGKLVIYKVEKRQKAVDEIEASSPGQARGMHVSPISSGWFSREDILILPYRFVFKPSSDNKELYCVALHELGHALGLEHNDGDCSVMYFSSSDFCEIAFSDIQKFCELHDCKKQPILEEKW